MKKIVMGACLVLLMPLSVLAAGITRDNFNKYTDGALNGVNGGQGWTSAWSADARFLVEGAVVSEGAKAISVAMVNGPEPSAVRTIAPRTAGTIQFAMGKDGIAHAPAMIVRSGDTPVMVVAIGADVQQGRDWIVRDGSFEYHIAPYMMGTLGEVTIQFDATTDQYRVSIDGGPYTDWKNFINPVDGVDKIELQAGSSGFETANLYWDDIRVAN